MDMAVLREVTLTLPMLPDMEIAASKTATAMAEYMGLSADKIDEVRMAVVEACINAIEHSEAPDRKVHITFSILGDPVPEKLQIEIADFGIGFAPDQVEEPRIEEKLTAERKRGWGLKIIQGLMDEVEVRTGDQGTTVIMTKARQAE
jgi:serine/threonine-protein kinase RsbW